MKQGLIKIFIKTWSRFQKSTLKYKIINWIVQSVPTKEFEIIFFNVHEKNKTLLNCI